jgi:hypothetical protein
VSERYDHDDGDQESLIRPTGEDVPWWMVNRANAWFKLNIAAVIAVGVYQFGWKNTFYPWLSRQDLIFTAALMGLVGAVPLIGWLRHKRHRTIAAWAILATVLVVAAAGRASGDAQMHRYYNCLTLSEREDEGTSYQTVACAPDSEPKQGGYYDRWSESDESRLCESPDPWGNDPEDPVVALARKADAADVTIWECERSSI